MRPHPRGAAVNPSHPEAWGSCDRCGFVVTHNTLSWQWEWSGARLTNLKILVCRSCLDVPQRQLGTILLPPDPMPVMNARPEQYALDEQPVSVRYTVDGRARIIEGEGSAWVIERIISVPGNLTFTATVIPVGPSVGTIALSGALISDAAGTGTVIGTASIVEAFTGTPLWALVSNPGGLYAIDASSGALSNAVSPLSVGTDPITIGVTGVNLTVPDAPFNITVVAAGSVPELKFNVVANSQYVPLLGSGL